ncbi:hypothetical protein REPUB_Repub20aG0002300 [Reevesia pubescens]
MASFSISKPFQLKPSIYPRISILLHFFSTTQDPNTTSQELHNAPPQLQQEDKVVNNQRTPRCKTQNPERVEDIICRMMENRAWTTHLQNFIRALVPEFEHSLVYNVLHGAKNSEHALQFFRYGKASIVQEAVKIFQKMKELGVDRTIKSYDTYFKVILQRGRYMMAKRLDTAIRFYEDMKARGISPDVVTYNTMINGYSRFKRMEEAEQLFVEMKGKNLVPTVISYTTMIKGCKSGDLNAADDVLKAMIRSSIPTEASHYGVLIENFCKVNEFDQAIKLLDKLVEKEIVLRPENSLDMEASAYNPMIQYLCQNG